MAPTKASEPADAAIEDRPDEDSFVEAEEDKDDKMRRIARTLEAGDVVEEAHVSTAAASCEQPLIAEHHPYCRCRCLS
jgi:hypothetical protein